VPVYDAPGSEEARAGSQDATKLFSSFHSLPCGRLPGESAVPPSQESSCDHFLFLGGNWPRKIWPGWTVVGAGPVVVGGVSAGGVVVVVDGGPTSGCPELSVTGVGGCSWGSGAGRGVDVQSWSLELPVRGVLARVGIVVI
jgi:hypothetical protein